MNQVRERAHKRIAESSAPESTRSLAYFKKILKKHLPKLKEKYHVKSLGIFGSYVRGDQSKRSDLDILVEFLVPPSLFTFIELEHYLSDLLEIKVDLVMRSALKPRIGQRILSEVVWKTVQEDIAALKPLILQVIEQELRKENTGI